MGEAVVLSADRTKMRRTMCDDQAMYLQSDEIYVIAPARLPTPSSSSMVVNVALPDALHFIVFL